MIAAIQGCFIPTMLMVFRLMSKDIFMLKIDRFVPRGTSFLNRLAIDLIDV